MAPALTLTAGTEVFTFDDDELCSLTEMNFLYGQSGAKTGRLLVQRATLSDREVVHLAMFLENVRSKLAEPLVVYDHGHAFGTVCFQHRPWYDLVKRSGLGYAKPTRKYIEGQKGKLESIQDVLYVRGRCVRDDAERPQVLGDLPPVASALEKLRRAVTIAQSGTALSCVPRRGTSILNPRRARLFLRQKRSPTSIGDGLIRAGLKTRRPQVARPAQSPHLERLASNQDTRAA